MVPSLPTSTRLARRLAVVIVIMVIQTMKTREKMIDLSKKLGLEAKLAPLLTPTSPMRLLGKLSGVNNVPPMLRA